VVLGLGRHSPIDRILGSETALGVLRRAGCPVLAVPAGGAATFRRAVAAVDFSAASVRAAEAAAALLEPDATLALVHVRPETSALLAGGAAVLAAWEEAYRRRTDELLARVSAMLRARRPDLRVAGVVRAGSPADQTLAVAGGVRRRPHRHRRRGGERRGAAAARSVSTAIVRRSTAAVLACREPGPAEVARLERALFGVTERSDRAAWAAMLADVSARNAGRRTRAEVDGLRAGAGHRGSAFVGAATTGTTVASR
jgi:nucleotide-binding universal stress UspA family protein